MIGIRLGLVWVKDRGKVRGSVRVDQFIKWVHRLGVTYNILMIIMIYLCDLRVTSYSHISFN